MIKLYKGTKYDVKGNLLGDIEYDSLLFKDIIDCGGNHYKIRFYLGTVVSSSFLLHPYWPVTPIQCNYSIFDMPEINDDILNQTAVTYYTDLCSYLSGSENLVASNSGSIEQFLLNCERHPSSGTGTWISGSYIES